MRGAINMNETKILLDFEESEIQVLAKWNAIDEQKQSETDHYIRAHIEVYGLFDLATEEPIDCIWSDEVIINAITHEEAKYL